ncbi:hypothetical protein F7734_05505 [Scytonema sp. UIC 10036]|nr:hypothetical protein [Scytonema sp. UIC 10036]MUG91946.1 hypothetical protein [Scytonema sp. UIC 10036]
MVSISRYSNPRIICKQWIISEDEPDITVVGYARNGQEPLELFGQY